MHPPPGDIDRRAEEEPDRDAQRHEAHREQEEHGHEDDLRRDGEARSHLELDPRRDGVGDDEEDEDAGRDHAARRRQEREGDGDRHEGQGAEERGARVSRRQALGARARILDEPAGLGIQVGGRGRGRGHLPG